MNTNLSGIKKLLAYTFIFVYVTCADVQKGQKTDTRDPGAGSQVVVTHLCMMWLLELNSGSLETAALCLKNKMGPYLFFKRVVNSHTEI